MTEAQAAKTTPEDIRSRVEEIAIDAYIDTSDQTEPLDDLIQRVRVGLQEELERMADLFQEFETELDAFEGVLAETAKSSSEQSI
jgi:hypothetical protein